MRFETLAPLLLTLVATACGAGNQTGSSPNTVGRPPQSFSAAYLWSGGDQNALVAVDRSGHSLQRFSLEPFAHVQSLALPLKDDDQGVVASSNSDYFLTTAAEDYGILRADGTFTANPVPMLGRIEAVAFDPAHDLVVLSDAFQSMALLRLRPDGGVAASWKAGALVSDGKYVVAGAMLGDGNLVLTLTGGTVAVVDVAASIETQAWKLRTFDVAGATGLTWVAAVPGVAGGVMMVDGTRLLSVNAQTGTVTDQKDLAGASILGSFRDYAPHVVSRSTAGSAQGLSDVTYVGGDGKFVTKSLRGADAQITQTWLDPGRGVLTVVYDPDLAYSPTYTGDDVYSRKQVYRFRLADDLALDLSTVDDRVELLVTPDYLFGLYPSALGKAARMTYGHTPDVKGLEGYDLGIVTR